MVAWPLPPRVRIRRSLAAVFAILTAFLQQPAPKADGTAQSLPLAQDWTNVALITTNDNWAGVPGIVGYRGDDSDDGDRNESPDDRGRRHVDPGQRACEPAESQHPRDGRRRGVRHSSKSDRRLAGIRNGRCAIRSAQREHDWPLFGHRGLQPSRCRRLGRQRRSTGGAPGTASARLATSQTCLPPLSLTRRQVQASPPR